MLFAEDCFFKLYGKVMFLFWEKMPCQIQEPAIDTLKEVEAFLTQNPSEIVTIIIEDYVHTPKGLTRVFHDAGLDKYWYPVAKMPKKGQDWPTVNTMVQNNYRLLVFTSDSSKEATEGIAYQWKYMVENERKCVKWIY